MTLREELLTVPELRSENLGRESMLKVISYFKKDEFFKPFLKELDLGIEDEQPLIDRILEIIKKHNGPPTSTTLKDKMNIAISEGMIKPDKIVDYVKLIG